MNTGNCSTHPWCGPLVSPKDADDKTPFSRLVMAVPFVGKATMGSLELVC